ncbi:MAG: ATP-binding protein, partial [Bdellovibrionales bacterium]
MKTSLIYGPNASGKSSFLDALDTFRGGILFSANTSDEFNQPSRLPHDPFLGFVGSDERPSFYEVAFSLSDSDFDGVYKYNFSITADSILEESLREILPNGEEKEHLTRNGQNIIFESPLLESVKALVDSNGVRKSALFTSVAAQLNNPFATLLTEAFKSVNVINGVFPDGYKDFTIKKFKEDTEFKNLILSHLQKADFCISGGVIQEEIPMPPDAPATNRSLSAKVKKNLFFLFEHPIFNDKKEKVDTFKLRLNQESVGTQSFLHILGPVLDTLEKGKILFIDELDNSLHPLLTKFIIDM